MEITFVRISFFAFCLAAFIASGQPSIAQAQTIPVIPEISSNFAQEHLAAAEAHSAILKRYGGKYSDRKLENFVNRVGSTLDHSFGLDGYQFKFFVLDSSKLFAFTQPGGYIYISRAMILLANSEDELAAVLAHEMAHVYLRHHAKRVQLVEGLNARQSNPKEFINAFNRIQEQEADTLSVPILMSAGYDPFAQARFLSIVENYDHVRTTKGIETSSENGEQSHFSLSERRESANSIATILIAELSNVNAGIPAQFPGPGYIDYGSNEKSPFHSVKESAFFDAIDGVVFGRRPSEGMIVNNTFIAGRAGFTFDIPPDFHFVHVGAKALPYVGTTIRAIGPNGIEFRFDSFVSWKIVNTDLIKYLSRNSGLIIKQATARKLEINGLPGAIAEAISRSNDGTLRVGVVQATAKTLFRFSFWIPPGTPSEFSDGVWQSPLSFKRVYSNEMRNWKPMKVRSIKVSSGMTVKSLSSRMPINNDPEEWFRVLNNLNENDKIYAGQRVKIVVH